MPLARRHPIIVQPYFGYRTHDRLCLSARVLRARRPDFALSGRWRALRTMIAQFASHEVAAVPVTLEASAAGGKALTASAVSDPEGFVHFDLAIDRQPLPETTQWEAVSLGWSEAGQDQSQTGFVLAPSRHAGLGIISDIDDTIVETGITGDLRAILRNWKRVIAHMPEERIAVPGVDAFYASLGGASSAQGNPASSETDRPPAPQRPFFYVSSSPWNLYSYLVSFKQVKGLPLGPMSLRDWGLNRETLGGSSHGAHKRQAIERILHHYPDLRFALIGDDTQGDLTAYSAIVGAFPDRIAAVFIRKLGEAMSSEEVAAQKLIKKAQVPLWLGPDFGAGIDFLQQTGLIRDHDARRVVETTIAQAW